MNRVLFVFICTILCESFSGETRGVEFDTLSGPLPSFVKAQKKPYLVISNIEVTPEKSVTIEAGAVFLFRNFTGLRVRGKLTALGNRNNPIIFTSVNNVTYNPDAPREANPYDWDGIYMSPDAIGTQLSFCMIEYSVYSLNSETKFIRLQPLFFKENGKEWVTIEDKEFSISNEPFNYVLEQKDAMVDGVPIELFRDPVSRKRNFTRYFSLSTTMGAIAAGSYFLHQTSISKNTLEARSDTSFINTNPYTEKDWKNARKELDRNASLLTASILVTLLGTAGFYWTFHF